MKKTVKAITAVMVVLTLCLGLLAGCAGGSPVGTWKLTGAEAMGMTVDPATMGDTGASTMTFNADGTITAGGKTGGEWKLNGSELTITEEGVTMTAQFTGSNIIIDMSIAKLTYSRA